jgi:pyruvate/2-oxoglutarate dehydrogenase complex dihydrolipoamide acyltransferase (E2) component
MKKGKGYNKKRLDFTRKLVIASVNGNKKNAIHCVARIDVTNPRRVRTEHFNRTGEKLSFTAYIVKCFAETVKEFPEMNSFIRGRNLIILEDINISVLVERELDGVKVPEPLSIKQADNKSIRDIQDEIRKAQDNEGNQIGNLSNASWVNYIPGFLLKTFIKIADRNISMAKKYGKIAVTAVGMHSSSSSWFIPHGTATVLLTIGSIIKENVLKEDGSFESREILHLTASFDHEIIDGSPAARFMKRLEEVLSGGGNMIY